MLLTVLAWAILLLAAGLVVWLVGYLVISALDGDDDAVLIVGVFALVAVVVVVVWAGRHVGWLS